ncbi:MAG: hypothetical protein HRT70_05380 [Flavobacteriaceae bacterium]|nr:hypothetical protein [Flavobacteriaceae bacterium]
MENLDDIYKLEVDRAFSGSVEQQEVIIEIIEAKILYYKEKNQVTSDDDTIIESIIYWVADYLPRNNQFADRINKMIDDLWACRDRYLNDELTYCAKKGY